MKKRKMKSRVFAFAFAILAVSLFVVPSFAYSPPIADDEGKYVFDSSNVLGYGLQNSLTNIGSGYTIVTSSGNGLSSVHQETAQPLINVRFKEPIFLDASDYQEGREYFIFTFIIDAPSSFDQTRFCVFDSQFVFPRSYQGFVEGLYVENYDGTTSSFPCFYNRVSLNYADGDKYIDSLAYLYNGVLDTPLTFVSFIVELGDTTTYYIGEGGGLYFAQENPYKILNSSFGVQQMQYLVQLNNSTVYTFEAGYASAVDYYEQTVVPERVGTAYQDGSASGYSRGYTAGVASQKIVIETSSAVAFEQGVIQGQKQGGDELGFGNLIFITLETPFNVLKTVFDFELLGFNIATFIFSLITLFFVIKVVKMVI